MNPIQTRQGQDLLLLFSKILILAAIAIALDSCGYGIPPEELAPNNRIIAKAIVFQIAPTEQNLAQQLEASAPNLKITNISVARIEPRYIGKLPTYHLQGKYNLKLKLSRRQVTQTNNSFDLYLQRQGENHESHDAVNQTREIWRLLKPEKDSTWSSYLIK